MWHILNNFQNIWYHLIFFLKKSCLICFMVADLRLTDMSDMNMSEQVVQLVIGRVDPQGPGKDCK